MAATSASGVIPALCALGGEILPLAAARISPLDRGFLFGDGVYETMKVLGGRPLFLAQHLTRLDASLAGLAIQRPRRVEETIAELLAATGPFDGSLYLQVTRERSPPGSIGRRLMGYPRFSCSPRRSPSPTSRPLPGGRRSRAPTGAGGAAT